jgi:uncharacterized protein (DUF302 family)
MPDYTLSTTVQRGYDETVQAVRESLADAGFGVLTEIDLRAVLKSKLGVEMSPQIILGACRPQLAHQALQADPSIAALLPCNVVVRGIDDTTTSVEAFDPDAMMSFAGADGSDVLGTVATEARQRLQTALTSLEND